MNVLVDTGVWSQALRRRRSAKQSDEQVAAVLELKSLIQDGRVVMIGPVRQEILSGTKEQAQYDRLREHLRAFPDFPITTTDYEEAASCFNQCRKKGIQGSNTDFLICALAIRCDLSIFTVDGDFDDFADVLPIKLHKATD
jgi:predicted nucleic acid-binding protein